MAVDKEAAIGLRGLNLGADPAQLVEGALTVADGIRFLESGAAHSRGGRMRAGLSFPAEGNAASYETDHFKAPGRVRGLTPFYDQRVWSTNRLRDNGLWYATTAYVTNDVVFFTTDVTRYYICVLSHTNHAPPNATYWTLIPPGINPAPPQRLNWLYKANGRVFFNAESRNDGTGTITAPFSGDLFDDPETRAKFVVYGNRCFIVDEGSRPKVFQQMPSVEQFYSYRVKYDVRNVGIVWPTATNQAPATITTVSGTGTIAAGTYKFRIMLENKFGTTSSASMPSGIGLIFERTLTALLVDWSGLVDGWPETPTKVRLYVQFSAYSTAQLDPSDYLFWKSVGPTSRDDGADNLGSARWQASDFVKKHNLGSMPTDVAAPPKLRDLVIINDVAFGIASYDTVYREGFISEGGQRLSGDFVRGDAAVQRRNHGQDSDKLYENTEVKQIKVDPSYLFWSKPGEPHYMENYVQVGKGSEVGIGLAELGKDLIFFTNVAIYSFDVDSLELKRTFSKVGCLSRDSIVETEQGIRFIASDGVPRLFNGATVDEITTELLPIFDRDDYRGAYDRFDKQYANEVQVAYGKRKFYMNYATSSSPGQVPAKPSSDTGTSRNLAVGDGSRGATLWSIDRQSLDYITWLGKESRMLGIDASGFFYFIEEGLVDEQPASGSGPSSIFFDLGLRRLAAAGGTQGYFNRIAFDIDTQGQDMQVALTIDDNPDLSLAFTVNTARRDEFKTWLPAFFMGRYMDIRIAGSTTSRVAVYPVLVDSTVRGEF